MIFKILMTIFGIVSFLLGVDILYEKGFNHHGIYIDLSESYISFSIISFAISILFIAIAIRSRKNTDAFEEKCVMCTSCIKPYYEKDLKNGKCPVCQSKVERLEGFYERHPELKS
jgi:hypothetical protein